MKAKVKFDSAQLKGFLIQHVEKIVFGGFVAAFLFLCWSAFKLKPYDKTPDELKSTAQQISQTVEQASPPEKIADLALVPDFTNSGALNPAPVDPRLYHIDPFSRPYEDRQELRKEPKFYGLLDLIAYAGYGGIAINEDGGVERKETSSFGSGMDGSMNPMGGMGGMMGGMGGMGGMMGGGQMPEGMTNPSDMMRSGMDSMMGRGMGGSQMPEGMDSSSMGMGMGNMGGASSPMGGMGMGGMGRNRRQQRSRRPTTAKKQEVKKAVPRPKPIATEKIVLTQVPRGAKVEGRYWVCLTGAVPYRQQFLEYQNTFRDARGYEPKRDFPRYALPIIERAEVVGGKTGNWESLDLEEALDDLGKWAVEYAEVVDKKFVDPDLTEPLPPLIFANHDKDKVTHPLTKVEERVAKVTSTTKKRKITSLSGGHGSRLNSQYANRRTSTSTLFAGAAGDPLSKLPEYRLFRFFDFDVDPGKTYRYRVKLQVENPNADVPPRFLQSYEYKKGETRETEFSPQSAPITVIAGNRLLAGGVAPGRGEPTGSVLAKLFDAEEAIEVRKVFIDIHRGTVLNQREMEIGVGDPTNPMQAKKSATVDFETNAVVLDMFGGEKLAGSRGAKVPGHVLILDNDGEFKTLLQASDSAMYETEQEEAKSQVPPKEGDKTKGPAAVDDGGANDPFKTFSFGDDDKSKGRKKR